MSAWISDETKKKIERDIEHGRSKDEIKRWYGLSEEGYREVKYEYDRKRPIRTRF